MKGPKTMSKKHRFKKLFSLIICLMLSFSFMGTYVSASDTTNKAPSVERMAENELSFSNLENLKPGEHIEFTITDQNGKPATIGIECIGTKPDDIASRATSNSWLRMRLKV